LKNQSQEHDSTGGKCPQTIIALFLYVFLHD
jgi:hypothetical protein